MPRGKYVNHKGRGRSFTSPEELRQQEQQQKKQNKRRSKNEGEEEEEEDEVDQSSGEENESDSDGSSDSAAAKGKAKGVEALLEGQIENPNRVVRKPASSHPNQSKASEGGGDQSQPPSSAAAAPELSRREREALEKQRARERYLKLQAEGKTEQAQKDLARLAIIRKEREEAAAKRLAEQKEKEEAQKRKMEGVRKAMGGKK